MEGFFVMYRFINYSFHCEDMVSWSVTFGKSYLVEVYDTSVITEFLEAIVHKKHEEFWETAIDGDTTVAVGIWDLS